MSWFGDESTTEVDNVAPRVEAGRDTNIRVGDEYRLKAKFDDRGRSDTHRAFCTIDVVLIGSDRKGLTTS